ncbi:MAG: hypothetical protein A2039_01705 [Candidatus Melainabacteria bacterium GWA2_34_9]|nr:MAG: hypothetical protein A2039_01705 [Candidatus Melainabacteria bacterium GWA2_34_9]
MNIGKVLAGVALFSAIFGTGAKKAVAQETSLLTEKGTVVCEKLKQLPTDVLKISGKEYFYDSISNKIKKKLSSGIEQGLMDIKKLENSPKLEKMVEDMGVCKNFGKNNSMCIQYKEPEIIPQYRNSVNVKETDPQLIVEFKKTF